MQLWRNSESFCTSLCLPPRADRVWSDAVHALGSGSCSNPVRVMLGGGGGRSSSRGGGGGGGSEAGGSGGNEGGSNGAGSEGGRRGGGSGGSEGGGPSAKAAAKAKIVPRISAACGTGVESDVDRAPKLPVYKILKRVHVPSEYPKVGRVPSCLE